MKNYCVVSVFVILFGFIIGCATVKLTSEEQIYLDKVKAFPLEFTIQKSEESEAWGRAQSFIGRFSSMKLQIVSDYVIQTFNPAKNEVDFGYYVTKTPKGDNIQINVECNTGNGFYRTEADTNAHILAYYIKTGELANQEFIKK